MATANPDKYTLKSLHEEIDLYDRKIAHLLKYDSFASEAERDEAARKMGVKRETLVKTARRLAEEGIEYKQTELPRSLRPKDTEMPVRVEEMAPVAADMPQKKKRGGVPSPVYAGTSLDWQQSVAQYLEKRRQA